MNKEDLIKKLTSRKFIAMLIGFATMVMVAEGMPDNQIAQISSIIGGFGAIITYIFAEGMIDSKREE